MDKRNNLTHLEWLVLEVFLSNVIYKQPEVLRTIGVGQEGQARLEGILDKAHANVTSEVLG